MAVLLFPEVHVQAWGSDLVFELDLVLVLFHFVMRLGFRGTHVMLVLCYTPILDHTCTTNC